MLRVKREQIRHKGYVARTCTVDLRSNKVNVTGAVEDEKTRAARQSYAEPCIAKA